MGTYFNTGNAGFQSARNSEYVDKSELIAIVNATLYTERRFTFVTRCRRFGKSLAAKMLNAYYDRSCDSRSLFADLKIAKDASFEKYLNQFYVIYLDTSDFVTRFHDDSILEHIDSELIEDIHTAIPDVPFLLFSFFEFVDSLGELSNKMSCLLRNTVQKYKKDGTFNVILLKNNQNLA